MGPEKGAAHDKATGNMWVFGSAGSKLSARQFRLVTSFCRSELKGTVPQNKLCRNRSKLFDYIPNGPDKGHSTALRMMELYSLIFLLSKVHTFPIPSGSQSSENFLGPLIETFVANGIKQLRNDANAAEKMKLLLQNLLNMFSKPRYANVPFLPGAVQMLRSFIEGGYFISPEKAASILKSVVYQATKEPDTVGNNITKIGNRLLKTAGNGISNVGSVTTGVIGLAKDLHETQASYTNYYTSGIPYLGSLIELANLGISTVFQGLHLGAKVALKDTGRTLSQYADTRKTELKKQKTISVTEIPIQEKGGDDDKSEDVDLLGLDDDDDAEEVKPAAKSAEQATLQKNIQERLKEMAEKAKKL